MLYPKILVMEEIHETNIIRSNYDFIMNNPEDKDSLWGWAFLEQTNSIENRIYIEILGADGYKSYIETALIRRPDVAEVYKDSLYEYCGFRAKIEKGLYPNGKLTMRVVIKSNNLFYGDQKKIKIKNKRNKTLQRRFNVAFIGGLVPAKGSCLAYEMIIREKETINWYIFGSVGKELSDLEQDNLYRFGKYDKNKLPQLLKDYCIDVVCILAIWPETFSYTVSEALLCKVPVLVTDIGAMGERIRKNGCGWIVDKNSSPQVIVDKLLEISENKEDYAEKKQRAVEYQGKTLREMAEEYQEYYKKSFVESKDWDYNREMISKAIVSS